MPNRILKESICTSDSLNSLGWFEEVLFYRLIVSCDDFGRFDGRMAVIKNRLFPLKENLTIKNVETAINKLARAGLVTPYESGGKPFLFLPTWNEHQSIRAKRSKYPEPENICKQMQADESKCPRNPIQSESNPNPIRNANDSAEPQSDSTPPPITLPLNNGKEFPVTQEKIDEFSGLYPAVDVMQQLRAMRGWLINNPDKRKTDRGINSFMNRWLSKEQDKGGKMVQKRNNFPKSQISSEVSTEDHLARMQRLLEQMKGGEGEAIE